MASRTDWEAAVQKAAHVLRVVFGSVDEVVPWSEMQTALVMPERWTQDCVLPQILGNIIHFRANHGRIAAAWCAVCAVRHPIGAFWLLLLVLPSFYALFIRRGVVHLVAPKSGVHLATLMYPQLHMALVAGTLGGVLLVGRVTFLLSILVPPALFALGHALTQSPPSRRCGMLVLCRHKRDAALAWHATKPRVARVTLSRWNAIPCAGSETQRLIKRLGRELRAALRGDDGYDDDSMEGGDAADEPPLRSDELQRQIELIRQKYRCGSTLSTPPCCLPIPQRVIRASPVLAQAAWCSVTPTEAGLTIGLTIGLSLGLTGADPRVDRGRANNGHGLSRTWLSAAAAALNRAEHSYARLRCGRFNLGRRIISVM